MFPSDSVPFGMRTEDEFKSGDAAGSFSSGESTSPTKASTKGKKKRVRKVLKRRKTRKLESSEAAEAPTAPARDTTQLDAPFFASQRADHEVGMASYRNHNEVNT